VHLAEAPHAAFRAAVSWLRLAAVGIAPLVHKVAVALLSPRLIRDSRIQASGAENAVRGFRAGLARIGADCVPERQARISADRHGQARIVGGLKMRVGWLTTARAVIRQPDCIAHTHNPVPSSLHVLTADS
jgi:hypothetical protein